MFRAVINAEKLRNSIEVVSTLATEVKFSISERGMELKTVDPAKVAMVHLVLGARAFEEFYAAQGEIALDLEKLSNILSMAGKEENATLELDEEDHKLKIGVGSLAYTLSLLDPTAVQKEPRMPTLELPAHVTLPGAEMRKALKAAEMVSDHAVLGMNETAFFVQAKGDIDSVEYELPITSLTGLQLSDVRSMFSLDYLTVMSRSFGKVDEIKLELGMDYPLKLKFNISEDISVDYILAPRISED